MKSLFTTLPDWEIWVRVRVREGGILQSLQKVCKVSNQTTWDFIQVGRFAFIGSSVAMLTDDYYVLMTTDDS